jgi:hypothetical protein
MIHLIIALNQNIGKTGFLLKKILAKREEEFYFTAPSIWQVNKAANLFHECEKHRFVRPTNDSDYRGINYLICDDYEQFDSLFRKKLKAMYCSEKIKEIVLLVNDRYFVQNFSDILEKIRDVSINKKYSQREKDDITNGFSRAEYLFYDDVVCLENIYIDYVESGEDFITLDRKMLARKRLKDI